MVENAAHRIDSTNRWTRRATGALLAAAAWLGAGPTLAQDRDPVAYGAFLASECAPCHKVTPDQADSANFVGIPAIIGLPPRRFLALMGDYRSGRRENVVMQDLARSLDDEQTGALALYLASVKR